MSMRTQCFTETLLPQTSRSLTFIKPSNNMKLPVGLSKEVSPPTLSTIPYKVEIKQSGKVIHAINVHHGTDAKETHIESLRELSSAKRGRGRKPPSDMYEICFSIGSRWAFGSSKASSGTVAFNVEILDTESKVTAGDLSPLDRLLDLSESRLRSALKEMDYMRRREVRMHQTSESTSARIRMFSWISVAVLLGVGAVQGAYLKAYFVRKKLL